jgi:hypothetical protein
LERLCHQFRLPAKAYLGGGQIPLSAQAATTFTEKDVTDLLAIHAALVAGQPLAQVLKQWQQSQSLKSIAAPKESGNFRSALANVVQANVVQGNPHSATPTSVNGSKTASSSLTASLWAENSHQQIAKKPVFNQLLEELPRAPHLTVDELNQRYAKVNSNKANNRTQRALEMPTTDDATSQSPVPVNMANSSDDPLDTLFHQPAQPRLPMTQLPGLSADAIHYGEKGHRRSASPKAQPSQPKPPQGATMPSTAKASKSLVAAFNAHRQAVKSRRQPR